MDSKSKLLNSGVSKTSELIEYSLKNNDLDQSTLNEFFLENRLLSHYFTNDTNENNNLTSTDFFNNIKNNMLGEIYKSNVFNFALNKDQHDYVDKFLNKRRMFISAPASFGKTTIAFEVISRADYKIVIMIFPTNELIRENVNRARQIFNTKGYEIFNHVDSFVSYDGRKILICTAESAIELYTSNNLIYDFIFIDEVYKFYKSSSKEAVSDSRTKVYRDLINRALSKEEDVMLAGPYISEFLGLEKYNVNVEKYPHDLVYRNILTFSNENNSHLNDLFSTDSSKNFFVKDNVTRTLRLLTYSDKKIIVYFSRKDFLKKRLEALLNKGELANVNACDDHDLQELYTQLKEHILDEYGAIESSRYIYEAFCKGIVINTADIPRYIVKLTMYLYNNSPLVRTVFSTSTIIEGINTSTDVLVVENYKSGKKELTNFEIQNLNGRVARIGHSLSGVVLLPEGQTVHQEVEQSLNIVEDDLSSDEIYISNEPSLSRKQNDLKGTMLKEYSENQKTLHKYIRHVSHEEIEEIAFNEEFNPKDAISFFGTEYELSKKNLEMIYKKFTKFNQIYFKRSNSKDKEEKSRKYSHIQAAYFHRTILFTGSFKEFNNQLEMYKKEGFSTGDSFSKYNRFTSDVINFAFSKYLRYTCLVMEFVRAESLNEKFDYDGAMDKFYKMESTLLSNTDMFKIILEKNGIPSFIIKKFDYKGASENEVDIIKYCKTEDNQEKLSLFEKTVLQVMLD